MKQILLFMLCFCSLISCNQRTNRHLAASLDYTQYVNPFIGNADNGHTFPGACVPFGLIQVSPETGNDSWRYCSGFNYEDDSIMGFAQTHLNGTGCSDLGDILLFPFSGELSDGGYKSKFDKQAQTAFPGYYAVNLLDFDVDVELTATEHTAFHRYTFNKEAAAYLLVDMQSGVVSNQEALKKHVLYSDIKMLDRYTIIGHQEVKNWVRRHYYFVLKFDREYTIKEYLPVSEGERAKRLILDFDLKSGETLQVKAAISTVSIDGAMASLQKENPDWNFESVKEQARKKWNSILSRVDVVGSDEDKTNFYTSMYHLFIQPNNIADTDGRYRGANDSVFVAKTGTYYSTFSLWDTYRAAHPLYTILTPERVDDMIQSMLAHHKVQGYLPIWTLWGKESHCMIGNHAIPIIVDAYLKGFRGFDVKEAYEAIKETSTKSHKKSDWEVYTRYGYYPFDLVKVESVSRTLESAYDDYCVAQMAKALGKDDDYEYFMKRSDSYKKIFDPEIGLMRGKDSKGRWRLPFNQFRLSHAGSSGGDYTEGNAWQYTWHVQHDVEALIDMMGGKKNFVNKLDSLFYLQLCVEQTGFVSDVSGLVGQYAHGNEPSHHVIYMYNFADRRDKTQELVRTVFDRFYLPKPDGLCGNDDCGQMSAWYLFSAMGFYPVNPVGGEYILGAPQLKNVTLKLSNGATFAVEARNLSEKNKYVQSVELNGKMVEGITIQHADIMKGGVLVFYMTDIP